MIELQGIHKSFHKKQVLQNLSVTIPEGVVALLGPNGAGKTTLLRTLLELYHCDQGKIIFEGNDVTNKGILPNNSGYLPQSFGALPNLTCSEMLEYFSVLKGIPKGEQKKAVSRCLSLVNLSEQAKTKCGNLSGGMLRRLGIAQAMLGDPKIIIFDEPTSGLDPEERLRFKLLTHSLSKGRTIIISTHIVDDIEALCNYVVVMNCGRVIASCTSKEMAERAQGLVWKAAKHAENTLPDNAYIRAMREQPEGDMLFVLSEAPAGEAVKPTVEDGYLCCLKGMGGGRLCGESFSLM